MDSLHTDLFYSSRQRQLGAWMILLLGLFAVRVILQLQIMLTPRAYFPAFDDWLSALLPYPLLFTSQVLILIGGLLYVWFLFNTRVVQRPKLGCVLYTLGWVYWFVMLIRLVLGFTVLQDSHWFDQTLPALFHLLLANMLMLIGNYHRQLKGRLC